MAACGETLRTLINQVTERLAGAARNGIGSYSMSSSLPMQTASTFLSSISELM